MRENAGLVAGADHVRVEEPAENQRLGSGGELEEVSVGGRAAQGEAETGRRVVGRRPEARGLGGQTEAARSQVSLGWPPTHSLSNYTEF